jgi:hypothetical protein
MYTRAAVIIVIIALWGFAPLVLAPHLATFLHAVLQALALYQELLQQEDPDPLYHTYSAACYFYMGLTQQAVAAAAKVTAAKAVQGGTCSSPSRVGSWHSTCQAHSIYGRFGFAYCPISDTSSSTGKGRSGFACLLSSREQCVPHLHHSINWFVMHSQQRQQQQQVAQIIIIKPTAPVAILQGPRCPPATRIQFHCAHKRGDEDALMALHSSLGDSLEDQLSLAALHFNRGHHQVGNSTAASC